MMVITRAGNNARIVEMCHEALDTIQDRGIRKPYQVQILRGVIDGYVKVGERDALIRQAEKLQEILDADE